jgi:hypothetical protein
MTLRRARFSGVMITLLMAGSAAIAHAATMQIQNPDGGLASSKVQDNGKLVGIVGDFVNLEPGEHQLRIGAPRGYTLIVSLRVSEDAVTVAEAQALPGNCETSYETRWDTPTVASAARTKRADRNSKAEEARSSLSFLRVTTPQFGAPGNRRPCAVPAFLSCNKSMAIVTVNSTPPGAEIWVGDERMDVTTPATLSVGFCPQTENAKDILIRIPGRKTCPRSVALAEGVRAEVMCDLPDPM